jgi:hypothetical protein
MRLQDVLIQEVPSLDLKSYQRVHIHPPLDLAEISIRALIGAMRCRIDIPYEGDASLLLSYKNKEGGMMSLRESEAGETWSILQVQGGRSSKSYRVSTAMPWHEALADRTLQYAQLPDADVRHITMPQDFFVTNITDATNYDSVLKRYAEVRKRLKMRFSQEQNLYICDVTK